MPTVLHEAFFDHVKVFVDKYICDLPYNRDVISPMIHMNWSLEIADGSVMPDMVISVTAVEGPLEVVLIPFYGECALSETDDHVFRKVESVILAHLDVICVLVVLAREAADYTAPGCDSTISKTLCGGTDSDPKPLTLKQFINLRTTPRSFGEPVVIGDYTWCHLSTVEYFVWVKRDDGSPINIRSQDPADMAYGTLVPEISMDAVTEMLKRGLTKIKDSFVDFQKELEPSLDCTALAEATVNAQTDWRLASKRIMGACDITAHRRYVAWHNACFTKSDDSSYMDSEQADSEEEPGIVSTSERKRANTSTLPGSRFKIQKS
ncbi:hypothetical protein BD769DRAFT_1673853 [Suillus cothurnatus]|nr:hypothetical protein BD769DRAFT_1673853 [Suillus cothurnatus]